MVFNISRKLKPLKSIFYNRLIFSVCPSLNSPIVKSQFWVAIQNRSLGYEVKKELREIIWPFIHKEMIDYFEEEKDKWETSVSISAAMRPPYMTDNLILEEVRTF